MNEMRMRYSGKKLAYSLTMGLGLAAAFVAYYLADSEARSLRSELPERPDITNFPVGLERRLDAIETRLRLPWKDHSDTVAQLAGVYHVNGFGDEAAICYELLLSESGEDEDVALYRLADLASQSGDVETALARLRRCVETRPDYLPAQLKLAELEYKAGDARQTMERYRDILKMRKDQPQALLAIARNLLREKRIDEAVSTLKQLVVSNPNFAEGVALLSQALQQNGQDELAAQIRASAPRKKAAPLPDPWLDSLMIDCYDMQRLSFVFENRLKAGEFERALEIVDQMEAVRPDDPQVYQQRGYAFFQVSRFAEAAGSYERALALGGDPSAIRLFLADSLAKAGAAGKAERVARNEIADTGGSSDMLVLLAGLVAERSSGEQMSLLEQALEKDPYHGEANRELSKLYWTLGKREESIELLERLRQMLTQDVASRVMIGRYELEHDRPEAAIEPLGEAVDIDSSNQDARALLALACLRAGNEKARVGAFDSALSLYDRAIDVSADGEEAYLNKVRLCLRLERFDLAESTVAELIERRPNDPVLYVSLGDVRMASGDVEGARASWMEALGRVQGNRELRQAVERRLKEDG